MPPRNNCQLDDGDVRGIHTVPASTFAKAHHRSLRLLLPTPMPVTHRKGETMTRPSEQHELLLDPDDDRAIQPMLTRDATAAYLAVSTRTVDRLVQSGDLHAYRIGSHRRFRMDDVDSYIKSRME